MFCKVCGTENSDGSAFCQNCGAAFATAQADTNQNSYQQAAQPQYDQEQNSYRQGGYNSQAQNNGYQGYQQGGYNNQAQGGGYQYGGYNDQNQYNYQQNQYGGYQQYNGYPANGQAPDAPSTGMAILGFFLPVVGLILYLVWKDQSPLKAKSAGKGALIGVIVWVVLCIVAFILAVIVWQGSIYMYFR